MPIRLRPSLLPGALSSALLFACTPGSTPDPTAAEDVPSDRSKRGEQEDEPKADALPDAKTLLAESVEARGGAANFEAIYSYYIVSKMEAENLGLVGTAHTWWRDGDFYVENDMPGVGRIRLGSDDGQVWSDDPINGLRMIKGIEAEQAAWSTSRCLALDWEQYFKSATTSEVLEVEGTKIAVITFISPKGDEVTLNLDMATKMPISQSFKQANALGAMPVTVTFADFREVHGTQVAFKQLVDSPLTKMSSINETFDVNVEIADDKFSMPGPKALELPGDAGEKPAPVPAPASEKSPKAE